MFRMCTTSLLLLGCCLTGPGSEAGLRERAEQRRQEREAAREDAERESPALQPNRWNPDGKPLGVLRRKVIERRLAREEAQVEVQQQAARSAEQAVQEWKPKLAEMKRLKKLLLFGSTKDEVILERIRKGASTGSQDLPGYYNPFQVWDSNFNGVIDTSEVLGVPAYTW
jgi:hypothetical protein